MLLLSFCFYFEIFETQQLTFSSNDKRLAASTKELHGMVCPYLIWFVNANPEITHWLWMSIYQCTADLLFDWFWNDQASKSVVNLS